MGMNYISIKSKCYDISNSIANFQDSHKFDLPILIREEKFY